VQDVLGMGADAAENAEYRLHEQRRLDQAAIEEVREIVEVADVVALEFEPRLVVLAGREDEFDILESVAEDEIAGAFEIRPLPVELEIL